MTDLRQYLADTEHALADIRRELTPALAAMAGHATTGYPTATRLDPTTTPGPSEGPIPSIITNTRPGRHAADPHPDRHHLEQALRTMATTAATARGIIHRHTPPGEATPDEGDPGCTSCARIGQYMPRGKGMGALCRWCYDHRGWHPPTDKGPEMPAKIIVAAYHEHGRVTTKDAKKAGVPIHAPRIRA